MVDGVCVMRGDIVAAVLFASENGVCPTISDAGASEARINEATGVVAEGVGAACEVVVTDGDDVTFSRLRNRVRYVVRVSLKNWSRLAL